MPDKGQNKFWHCLLAEVKNKTSTKTKIATFSFHLKHRQWFQMWSQTSQLCKISIPMFHSVPKEFAKLTFTKQVKVLVTLWHRKRMKYILATSFRREHLHKLLTLKQSQARHLVQVSKMFPSFGYALVFCLMIFSGFSRSWPDNSKRSLAKTIQPQEKQSFVVNNNCGLGQNERQTLSLIKEKVDKIAANIKNGKFLKWH